MAYTTSALVPGASGRAVQYLQQRLNVRSVTSVYDAATLAAVSAAQQSRGLVVDGRYGAATNAALVTRSPIAIMLAAAAVGVGARALAALVDVETRGAGFYANGLPVILLERHYVARLCTAGQAAQLPASVCNTTRGGYVGGIGEWDRFETVARVSLNVAIQSCSWGLGQIMGANWQGMGYPSPQAFLDDAALNETVQIRQIARFVRMTPGLIAALNLQDWPTVARLYNGPASIGYDTKLAASFANITV